MKELLGRVDSKELSEWRAYYRLEPWGQERADLRSGQIAAVVANVMGGKKGGKGGTAWAPQDFMVDWWEAAGGEEADVNLLPNEFDDQDEPEPIPEARPIVAVSPKPVKKQQSWQEQARFVAMLHQVMTSEVVSIPES